MRFPYKNALRVAARKEDWFPDGNVWALVPEPGRRRLLGRSLEDFDRADEPDVDGEWEAVGESVVTGTLALSSSPEGDELILLAAGGRVVSITKVFGIEGTTAQFSFMLEPGFDPSGVEPWLLSNGTALRN